MKKIIKLTESDLTRLVRRVIKEDMGMSYTPEELEDIWGNVVRWSSPGFFDDDEARLYLLYDVAKGDRNLYNSLLDWFEENGKDWDTIRFIRTGIR